MYEKVNNIDKYAAILAFFAYLVNLENLKDYLVINLRSSSAIKIVQDTIKAYAQ